MTTSTESSTRLYIVYPNETLQGNALDTVIEDIQLSISRLRIQGLSFEVRRTQLDTLDVTVGGAIDSRKDEILRALKAVSRRWSIIDATDSGESTVPEVTTPQVLARHIPVSQR